LVNSKDADFEVSVAEAVDRRDINREVLNSVAALAGSTDLSFRKAAGNATFKFVSDLVEMGISIQYEISPTARAASVLDCFSIAAGQWFRMPPLQTLSSQATLLLSHEPRLHYRSFGPLLSLVTPARSSLAFPNHRSRRAPNYCLSIEAPDYRQRAIHDHHTGSPRGLRQGQATVRTGKVSQR
jgi:hypothetical protein